MTTKLSLTPIVLGAFLAVICGCHDSRYVAHEELAGALGSSIDRDPAGAVAEATRLRAEMQRQIDELCKRALTARTIEEKAKALLAAGELDLSGLNGTLLAIQRAVDFAAEDLANVNTAGYKRRRVLFKPGGQDLVMEMDVSRGPLQKTHRSLDLAIEDGHGFFRVGVTGQVHYTRAGCFRMNADGKLVDSDGDLLLPEITIPPEAVDVEVDADGSVSAVLAKQSKQKLGRIQLATFRNPGALEPVRANLYKETSASGPPVVGSPASGQLGTIRSGFLECSNTNVPETLVTMMQMQRWFEAVSRVITDFYPESKPAEALKKLRGEEAGK